MTYQREVKADQKKHSRVKKQSKGINYNQGNILTK